MKLTDIEAIKALKKVRVLQLEEMINDYPENEAGWLLEMFQEGETAHSDSLQEAREILSRTKYGKCIPVDPRTFKPKIRLYEIQNAKDTVNEYNRLVRFVAKLRKMGLTIGG